MKMINDQGGVNGRKINLIQYDDAYSPPKAVEQVRKLVESDEVLLTFQVLGTAVQRRGAEVSQRQEGAAAVRRHRRVEVHRPEEFPVDDGLQSRTTSSKAASTASTSSRTIRMPRSASSIRTTTWVRTI